MTIRSGRSTLAANPKADPSVSTAYTSGVELHSDASAESATATPLIEALEEDEDAVVSGGRQRRASSATFARITDSVIPASVADTAKQAYAQLCTFAELPHWMQDNEYIRTFYRPPTFSYRRCFASLGYVHNETGNIYSHGVGAVAFLALAGFTAHMISEQSTANWSDSFVFYVFLSGAIICLSLSATFHLFSCHSEKVSANWNRCDYIGIVALIVGSFYPIVYYTFYCHATARNVYLAVITALGGLTVATCVSRRFASPAFRSYRAGIFVALGGSGVVPMIHALIQYGWHHIVEGASLPWIATMGILYIVGAVIYAARVPERWWPGKFDIFLHSHQIFHLFVLTAATLHYIGLVRAFRWHHNVDPFCALNGLRRNVISP